MGNAAGEMPAISAGTRHRLADLILADSQRAGLGPGSRLPTERQLALDLGATRSSVRHALAVLQAEGRISREVGRGTFLRDAPPRPPGNGADGAGLDLSVPAGVVPVPPDGPGGFAPADVMTIRRLLEPLAMPLVVAWATAADFKEMDRCLSGGAAGRFLERLARGHLQEAPGPLRTAHSGHEWYLARRRYPEWIY